VISILASLFLEHSVEVLSTPFRSLFILVVYLTSRVSACEGHGKKVIRSSVEEKNKEKNKHAKSTAQIEVGLNSGG